MKTKSEVQEEINVLNKIIELLEKGGQFETVDYLLEQKYALEWVLSGE